MQNFKQLSIVILALLAGIALFVTKCSDPKLQEKITAETIYLNSKHKLNTDHQTDAEHKPATTNPKTLFVKKHEEHEEKVVSEPVAPKVEDTSSVEIEKLTKQRDEAINVVSALKDGNKNLEAENSSLKEKIDRLIEGANNSGSSTKEKIAASAAALLAAQQLGASKDDDLKGMIIERDEAIKVALALKDNNKELQDQLDSINEKTQHSTQAGAELEKLLQEQKQKVAELEKQIKELQDQKSELSEKVTSLEQAQTQNQSSTKEKIATAATALLAAKQLSADKDTEVHKLIKERDDAIDVTLKMKKDLDASVAVKEELTQKLNQCETSSKENLSALEAVKQSSIDKDENIDKLTKQRDEALQNEKDLKAKIEATTAELTEVKKLESQKNAQADLEKKKKLVIEEIVNSFKLSKVEFKTNSAILTKKSTPLLDKVANIMKDHKEYHYKIQGHTDSQGKEKHNLDLSNDRAKSVKDYLVSKGVDEKILSSKGFGSSKPIADNKTPKGRLANRRVVFEIED